MSDDSLQLSGELVRSLQEALVAEDPRAREPIVTVQYLAAVMGYMIAQMPEPVEQRKGYLVELGQFMQAVFEDVESQNAPAAPPQEASGVWRPGDP